MLKTLFAHFSLRPYCILLHTPLSFTLFCLRKIVVHSTPAPSAFRSLSLTSAYACIAFCFTLRCSSLYFAYAKLSFTPLRAPSAFRSLSLTSAYARIAFCFTLRCRSLYFAYAKLSFTQLRAPSAFRSHSLTSAYAKCKKKAMNFLSCIAVD